MRDHRCPPGGLSDLVATEGSDLLDGNNKILGGAVTVDSTTVAGNRTVGAAGHGGIYTTTPIAPTGLGTTTVTGNSPTNCLLSPAPVTGCIN
ncbi:hypothetical protein [Streptomyces sp. NPDC127084]|uniref:hypothetical protein n=1 Tax=Streptomyces sp. NPDC127084 TaxID=3347133 RepID=UPI00365EF1D6